MGLTVSDNECRTPSKELYGNEVTLSEQTYLKATGSLMNWN